MFFPKVNPVVQGLNSYYIVIDKLIEHFQGEIGSGVIYFRGSLSQGAVFFESEHFMESFFEKNNELVTGSKALNLILENCGKNNYEIYIYYVEPEYIYLWSEVSKARNILNNSSARGKDLNSIVQDFIKDKSTGAISVFNKRKRYSLFSVYGEIIGGMEKGEVVPSDEFDLSYFLRESERLIDEEGYGVEITTKAEKKKAKPEAETLVKKAGKKPDKKKEVFSISGKTIDIMGEFIQVFDKFVSDNKKIKQEFQPLLNRKFIEFVDTYDFLDPFAAEFEYRAGKINFTGKTTEEKFIESLVVCLGEIAKEQGFISSLKPLYSGWLHNHQDLILRHKLVFPFK